MNSLIDTLETRTLFSTYTAATESQLIGAITAANSSAAADIVTLDTGAMISLTTELPSIAANSGGLTIFGNGGTIERSSAAGTPGFRLINVAAGASLAMKNLTLQGGVAYAQGGAIFNEGTLSLDGVIVQNSTARGGVGSSGGYGPGKGGDGTGGGIYSSGALTLQGCTIRNNSAIGGRGGDGSLAPPSMPGNLTRHAYDGTDGGDGYGGGVYIAAGTATIRNSTITTNSAIGGAGGDAYHDFGVRSRAGSKGTSAGGGVYINPAGSVGLDATTVKQTVRNTASGAKDVFGSYTLIT